MSQPIIFSSYLKQPDNGSPKRVAAGSRGHRQPRSGSFAGTLSSDNLRLRLWQHVFRALLSSALRNTFDLVHQECLDWCLGGREWAQPLAKLAEVMKLAGMVQLAQAKWLLGSYAGEYLQQMKLARAQKWSAAFSSMNCWSGNGIRVFSRRLVFRPSGSRRSTLVAARRVPDLKTASGRRKSMIKI